jgi:16S rRNA (cytosine967-C5)-methyltransferase
MQQITPHCTKVAACVYSPDGIVVEGLPGIEHPAITPLWNQGHFYFQNEAAQLASLALDPQPGWNCVDLCSAPGGKASHLAQLMQNHDKVIAIESSAKKITRIHENLKRLKLHCVETVVGEANSTPAKKYLANANAVLLDPPCSALGTLRKSPEVRWLQSPTNIKKLAAQQWEILTHTIDSMRSGAIGVYSVCTFTVEETIDLLDRARHQRMDFEAMKISFPHPDKNVLKSILRDDSILTLPGQGPLDGYFIMRFRKR